jgi:hypothetical protein
MNLKLPFPPEPQYAPQFAGNIVRTSKAVSNLDLDYSIGSLRVVDDLIEGFRGQGAGAEQLGETLFCFGCYVGEVFVKNAGASWNETINTPMNGVAGSPLVLKLPNGMFCNPIDKVFKRLKNGSVDNLPYFYTVFSASKLKQ